MLKDLLFDRNKLVALLGIPGNGETGNREFNPKRYLDGGPDHRIKPENLLLVIWILGVSPDPDPGIWIGRQLGTTKEKGICIGILSQDDFRKDTSFEEEIKACILELILEGKNLVKHAWLVRVGLPKGKG